MPNVVALFPCTLVLIVLASAFHIAAIAIGSEYSQDEYCSGSISTTGSVWLRVSGGIGFAVNILALVLQILAFVCAGGVFTALVLLAQILYFVFNICWTVTGIVLLASLNDSCAQLVKPVYTMIVISVIVGFISICVGCSAVVSVKKSSEK